MTRFTLQISDQLNAWLTEQARLNHRSKNKQIEWLLDMARRMPINNKGETGLRVCETGTSLPCDGPHHRFTFAAPAMKEYCNCHRYTFERFNQ